MGIALVSYHACNLSLVPVAEHRDDEGCFRFTLWRLTKRVQAIRHEISLQVVEIPFKFHDEIIEFSISQIGQVGLEIVVKMQFLAFRCDRLLVLLLNGSIATSSQIERCRL
ncbi:MAG: hypothetical protein C5S52_04500 [ANME-2 cluster archaeon]|nr:hypothetical protein [ANME-2 cluster archaeon]